MRRHPVHDFRPASRWGRVAEWHDIGVRVGGPFAGSYAMMKALICAGMPSLITPAFLKPGVAVPFQPT